MMNYARAQNVQYLKSNSDCYVMVMNDSFKLTLARIDSIGELVWARSFGRDSMRNWPVSLTVLDNDDVIVGIYSDNGAFGTIVRDGILKFDKYGNNLFIKKFNGQSPGQVYVLNQIIRDGSGFTAMIADFNNIGFSTARVIKMNADGNRIRSITYPNTTARIFKSSDSDYYFYNNIGGSIVKLDSTFTFIVHKYFTMTPIDRYFYMIELSDSTFLLGGGTEPAYGCFIDKYDKNLNSIWRGQYGFQNTEIGNPVTLNQLDSNTVVVLTTNAEGFFNDRNSLFTIDLNGNLKKSGLFDNLNNVATTLNAQSDTRNGKFLFLNSELVFPNQFANYFDIYSTDSAFTNICNFHDTVFYSYILPPDFQSNTSCPIQNTQDSLVDDIMNITNVGFVFGECNDTTLSIASHTSDGVAVSIYPNPIFNELNVKVNVYDPVEFILFDISSRKILKQEFVYQISLNSEKLSKGIYIYEVRSRSGVIKTGKIVKN